MNIMRPTLPSSVPDFLYKYTSVDRALEVLRTGEVYFPHRQELNDPFDGRCIMDAATPEQRKEIIKLVVKMCIEHEKKGHDLSGMLSGMGREEYYNRFIEDEKFASNIMQKLAKEMDVFNIGVYCFTEKQDSIIMWAHYANNHKGCCLKFDFQEYVLRSIEKEKDYFPFSFLHSIKYSDTYPVSVFGEEDADPKKNSFYMCKSKDWQYEKEWRAIMYDTRPKGLIPGISIGGEIIDEPIIKRMEGSGLYPLDKNLINGIVLGCKMEDNEKESIIEAARLCRIRIYQAQPKLYEYGMEIELLNL